VAVAAMTADARAMMTIAMTAVAVVSTRWRIILGRRTVPVVVVVSRCGIMICRAPICYPHEPIKILMGVRMLGRWFVSTHL